MDKWLCKKRRKIHGQLEEFRTDMESDRLNPNTSTVQAAH